MPYYYRDPKRDHKFDNHPYGMEDIYSWGRGLWELRVSGFGFRKGALLGKGISFEAPRLLGESSMGTLESYGNLLN